ncbi:dihydropteroate synthase [Candidatus Poseidoniales archaeon]|nr:dihydropteroate synthase [Euryarchaeota archaeon]MDC3310110.1 dihydropteroate synthase [Candidatus Poseidoniales archaeon]MDG1542306.1 dihydropteroate synthase [Candidatus Thalassarchaeaceae archaeon]
MADWRPLISRRDDGFPRIMGVLNITPDSFYANSRLSSVEETLEIATKMIDNGADWLDIGGESTRPGAKTIDSNEEIARILPVIRAVRMKYPSIGISIDTRWADVAEAALDEGADMINDISALSDPRMIEVIKTKKCPICIMHMKGIPENMQDNPEYNDVVKEVREMLTEKVNLLVDAGIGVGQIIGDPGIGFGKLLQHNIALLSAGRDVIPMENMGLMWGVSRKRMFSDLLGRSDAEDRLAGTLGIAAMAKSRAVDIIRVHDVPEHTDLFRAMSALEDF